MSDPCRSGRYPVCFEVSLTIRQCIDSTLPQPLLAGRFLLESGIPSISTRSGSPVCSGSKGLSVECRNGFEVLPNA